MLTARQPPYLLIGQLESGLLVAELLIPNCRWLENVMGTAALELGFLNGRIIVVLLTCVAGLEGEIALNLAMSLIDGMWTYYLAYDAFLEEFRVLFYRQKH